MNANKNSAEAMCTDTYNDALSWAPERIEAEQSALRDFMALNWPVLGEAGRRTLVLEHRALSAARRAQQRE